MTEDRSSEGESHALTTPGMPEPGDWRGWMRWAVRQDWTEPATWRRFTLPWTVTPQPEDVRAPVEVEWTSFAETEPGDAFAEHWRRLDPHLERWWRSDGRSDGKIADGHGEEMLKQHMPELVPVWASLVELAGGSRVAASILTLWNPPPFLTGCSQAVVGAGGPALVRNYDWDYRLFDATVAHTGYLGRRVVGTEDCGWGLLDGVNDAGLAVSLTFGGRPQVGEGFGIPLVLRYVLQTCMDVEAAVAALVRIPVHMSYNVTLTDLTGRASTVFVAPDRPARATRAVTSTNHQGEVEWRPYCDAIRSEERLAALDERLDRGDDVPELTGALLRDPLYARRFHHGFGTLYTAVIRPEEQSVTYQWPGRDPWTHAIERPRDDTTTVRLLPGEPPDQP